MSKPKYIQADYIQTIEFDLDDLGIDWDKVEDYSIKYSQLNILYKDGTEESHESTSDYDIDWKWAKNETFLNNEYEEVRT